MRKRNHHVSVWMDDEELNHLREQAKIAGLPVDRFVRNLVAGVELRPHPPEAYLDLVRELSAIGRNINQIAFWANAQRSVHESEIYDAIGLVQKVWQLVKDKL